MGAAELLDYDRARLRGLVIEDGGGQSHVAIVARALGIAAVGQARGVIERVDPGNPIIVDADAGEVYIRPTSEVISAYADKARFQARRQRQYRSLRDEPAVTKDGERIELQINAGLPVDTGASRSSRAPTASGCSAPSCSSWWRPISRGSSGRRSSTGRCQGGARQAGRLPHARYRRRQGAALHAPRAGGEPGARLARHPHGARPARAVSHPGAGAAPGGRRPGAARYGADGLGGHARSLRRGRSSTARSNWRASAAWPGPAISCSAS